MRIWTCARATCVQQSGVFGLVLASTTAGDALRTRETLASRAAGGCRRQLTPQMAACAWATKVTGRGFVRSRYRPEGKERLER
jgi:hypothetical protein